MKSSFIGLVVKKVKTKNLDGVNRHRSWLETDQYISRHGKRKKQSETVEFIESTLAGEFPKSRATEMESVFKLAPGLKNKTDHLVLSFPTKESSLSKSDLICLVNDFVASSNYQGCDFVCFAHRDTSNFHLHLLLSRVLPNGQIVKDSNDYKRLLKTANEISLKYKIRHFDNENTFYLQPRKPKRRERDRLYIDRQKLLRKNISADKFDPIQINKTLRNSNSLHDFQYRLLIAGFETNIAMRNGKPYGFKLRQLGSDNDFISGSSISPDFGLGSLNRYFERSIHASKTKPRAADFVEESSRKTFENRMLHMRTQPLAVAKRFDNRVLHNNPQHDGYSNRPLRWKSGISKFSSTPKWSFLIGFKLNNHLVLLSLPNDYPTVPTASINPLNRPANQFVSNKDFFKP